MLGFCLQNLNSLIFGNYKKTSNLNVVSNYPHNLIRHLCSSINVVENTMKI
jgi:hypothetical protein